MGGLPGVTLGIAGPDRPLSPYPTVIGTSVIVSLPKMSITFTAIV